MIKAIFFDIDGTLLSYRTHKILEGTLAAFDQLRKKGIKTFISSGRPRVLIPSLPVTFDGYITVNGGLCTVHDTVIYRNAIAPEDCQRWLNYVEKHHLTTMCFTEKEMYINQADPVAIALRDELGFEMPPLSPLSEMEGKEVYQFIAIQPQEDDDAVLANLAHCRMPRWHRLFTDLIPDNSSKAIGIEKIINHFGISPDETMAFGDGANDIEMLDYVKIGVAMGNAAPIVKQHAQYITDDADSEGILHALQHFEII